ncbi:MAG: AraC family transcriptional regulator [Pseudomonadota bacterium]
MAHLDRLTDLTTHFALHIEPAAPEAAQLFILESDMAHVVMLTNHLSGACQLASDDRVLFAAQVNWGGARSPMLSALPGCLRYDTRDDPDIAAITALICAEHADRRCGAGSVLNRLAEVLFIRLLRAEVQRGSIETGLLAGLGDPRLARALVAMHGAPGKDWSNSALANEAGLSLSRFLELFRGRLGETPQAYLRHWRLSLAQRDLERGDRIDALARRYGYGSPEALTPAFRRATGLAPTALRRA